MSNRNVFEPNFLFTPRPSMNTWLSSPINFLPLDTPGTPKLFRPLPSRAATTSILPDTLYDSPSCSSTSSILDICRKLEPSSDSPHSISVLQPCLPSYSATANGETFEDTSFEEEGDEVDELQDTDDASPIPPSAPFTTLSRPRTLSLSRAPSTPEFIAASKAARVNPLTLQAVARKGSETEAMKVIREREDRDRKWKQVDDATRFKSSRQDHAGPGVPLPRCESPEEVESHDRFATEFGARHASETTITGPSSSQASNGSQKPSFSSKFNTPSSTMPPRMSLFGRLRNRTTSSMSTASVSSVASVKSLDAAIPSGSSGFARSEKGKEREIEREKVKFVKVRKRNFSRYKRANSQLIPYRCFRFRLRRRISRRKTLATSS